MVSEKVKGFVRTKWVAVKISDENMPEYLMLKKGREPFFLTQRLAAKSFRIKTLKRMTGIDTVIVGI